MYIDGLKNNYDLRKGADNWRKQHGLAPGETVMHLGLKILRSLINPEQKTSFTPLLQRANAAQLEGTKFRYNPFTPSSSGPNKPTL